PAGSLISLPLDKLLANQYQGIHTLFKPTKQTSIQRVAVVKNDVYVTTLDNVRGRLTRYAWDAKAASWTSTPIQLPKNGAVGLSAGTAFTDDIYIRFTDFVTPDQLFELRGQAAAPQLIKTLPTRFDAAGVTVSQFQATSADGVQVPYFLVTPKGYQADGTQPTLLYGYGGFEVSMTPQYMATFGKLWVERGGAFVIANIRGGGEFGPKWHRAAKKEKRQRAFDDFLAVAEHLISAKVTTPSRLGIMGGSNGGLLMGASFTQRPELFGAVVCQVPLLDMIRYPKLLAGASWMDEYGDPSKPEMRAAILKYSPYHNLKEDKTYPPVFFITSTKDDRVHPAHARKMAAKMASLSKPFWYFENIEGGHSASANRNQRAQRTALEFVYLWTQLGRGAASAGKAAETSTQAPVPSK
ncbi:MAG: prolyl oligopeptidase family serine peptidase, partial [Myxococcota bacterium]|nr:prolyl oligopeptidase family serine peptidase [Myxococcota bacterium]